MSADRDVPAAPGSSIWAPPSKSIEKFIRTNTNPISDSTMRTPEKMNHRRLCSMSWKCGTV